MVAGVVMPKPGENNHKINPLFSVLTVGGGWLASTNPQILTTIVILNGVKTI